MLPMSTDSIQADCYFSHAVDHNTAHSGAEAAHPQRLWYTVISTVGHSSDRVSLAQQVSGMLRMSPDSHTAISLHTR